MKERPILISFKQEGDSCIIVSSALILQAYTSKSVEEIIELFLEINNFLFSKFHIPVPRYKGSILNRYNYLNKNIYHYSNMEIQFNHKYIKDSFSEFYIQNGISATMPVNTFVENPSAIELLLKESNSFISLSIKLRQKFNHQENYHALPISFSSEFYAADTWENGYISLGNNIVNSIHNYYNSMGLEMLCSSNKCNFRF